MARATTGMLPLLLLGLLALTGASISTASAVQGPASSSNLRRVYEAAKSVKAHGEARKLQDYADEICVDDIPGINYKGKICCANSCGTCAGDGCSKRDGGHDACCQSGVMDSGNYCSDTKTAPCIIKDAEPEICVDGIPGINYKGKICCANSCGTCAGDGCSKRDGGHDACCQSGVMDSGNYCSDTKTAPCIIKDAPPETTPAPVTDETCGEAGSQTGVSVSASGYDTRPGSENGCRTNGCQPRLAYDGSDNSQSRWSCRDGIVPGGGQCDITFAFASPQDVKGIDVSFWKFDERARTLKVIVDGKPVGKFTSPQGVKTTSFDIDKNDVSTITLESLDLGKDKWISLLEVNIEVCGDSGATRRSLSDVAGVVMQTEREDGGMEGIHTIRGSQDHYRVAGPLEIDFTHGHRIH